MLLTLFRRHLRRQTVAVLLTLAVCGGTVEWSHGGWDDPGCDPVSVQHDHSAHRMVAGTGGREAPADHCALCHLLRLLHTALSTEPLAASAAASAESRRPCDGTFIGAVAGFSVPPRAPPAVIL